MKFSRPFSKSLLSLKGAAAMAALGAVAPTVVLLAAPAKAAPKQTLGIWPGQRVLLVLPITIGTSWNQDAALGTAVLPLVEPELQRALKETRKFSVTAPYRFDPVIQRALIEKQITDDEVKALTEAPALGSAQALFSKLKFEQPAMFAQVILEELRVSGAGKNAAVQIVATGNLYQQGIVDNKPVKSIRVTSRPVSGGSSEDRIARSAREAFADIAAEFIAPAQGISLTPGIGTLTATAPTPAPVTPGVAPPITVNPIPPGSAPVTAPNSLSPQPGGPFIPVLPPARPPLGITVPNEPVSGR